MLKNISQDNNTIYKITSPGEHIFYFENRDGKLTFDIKCENADVKIYGFYECTDSDKITLHITQKHSSPNSTSSVLIKSILKDKSIFNFKGTINVSKNAINSTAYLINNNLLLSNKSHVITMPQLEVIPHNTKCTHTATITPLDNSQLQYMMTRGIALNSAKELLINGFIEEFKNIQNT